MNIKQIDLTLLSEAEHFLAERVRLWADTSQYPNKEYVMNIALEQYINSIDKLLTFLPEDGLSATIVNAINGTAKNKVAINVPCNYYEAQYLKQLLPVLPDSFSFFVAF